MEEKILEFPSTAGFKEFTHCFSKGSVAHPAKANLLLLKYLVENYTEEGKTLIITKEILIELDKTVEWCNC